MNQGDYPSGASGGLYPITASVQGWTGTNSSKVNLDTASSTITIDNMGPTLLGNMDWSFVDSSATSINAVTYGSGTFVAVFSACES
jgi:hypothetical protein